MVLVLFGVVAAAVAVALATSDGSGSPAAQPAGASPGPLATAPAGSAPPGSGAPRAPVSRWAAVDGSGSACSEAAPCSVADAVLNARSGTTVGLQPGSYPQLKLTGPGVGPVDVVPASGTVTLASVDLQVPDVTLRGVTVTDQVFLRGAGSGLVAARTSSTVFLEADRTRLIGTRIRPKPGEDAIQVRKGARGALVQGNTAGPALRISPENHLDCIQVLAAADLVVRDNIFYRCAAQTMLVNASPGPVTNVLIENNWFQGCGERTPECDGYRAVQIRGTPGDGKELISKIVLRNNTVDGVVLVEDQPGTVVEDNVIVNLAGCPAQTSGNVLGQARCPAQAASGAALEFKAPEADPPDLTLVGPSAGTSAGAHGQLGSG